MLYLKQYQNEVKIDLVHPGITASNLFDARHGGFSKVFGKTILPLMHILFPSPAKAALSAIEATHETTKLGYWYGPRGLFHVWGCPKMTKLSKRKMTESCQQAFQVLEELKKKYYRKEV